MNESMGSGTTVFITTGLAGSSPPEEILNRGLVANTLDLLDLTDSIAGVKRQVLMTNSKRLMGIDPSDYPKLTVQESGDNFHFGENLFAVVEKSELEGIFYLGGGSGPLLGQEGFQAALDFLESHSDCSLANNFYSTDMIGFTPGERILSLEPPEKDNELGWLTRDAGLKPYEMERSARTLFDLDTPLDLLSFKLCPGTPDRLSRYTGTLDWKGTRLREIVPQFTDRKSRLVLAGRIGAATWSYLEKNAACQVDVFSEGRGSYGDTPPERDRPYLLGRLFEERGPRGFITTLLERGTGLFLDTRVLFNYLGEWPTRRERFASDLLNPGAIRTDYLKELTRAALESPEPVVLGGHNTISGALFLLADGAWELAGVKSENLCPETWSLETN